MTWEHCANVRFLERTDLSAPNIPEADIPEEVTSKEVASEEAASEDVTKMIRISFQPAPGDDWYWSRIGTNGSVLHPSRPTMLLAGLLRRENTRRSLEEHRGHILHEFGHALGLRHEHQSPDAERVFKLDEQGVLNDPRYIGKEGDARHNVLEKFTDTMNYTKFDKDSIMV